MIALGLILLVVGWLAGISILTTLGVVLLVIGAILAVLGAVGKPIGGRAHYF
jgi:bacteriorhodopsin